MRFPVVVFALAHAVLLTSRSEEKVTGSACESASEVVGTGTGDAICVVETGYKHEVETPRGLETKPYMRTEFAVNGCLQCTVFNVAGLQFNAATLAAGSFHLAKKFAGDVLPNEGTREAWKTTQECDCHVEKATLFTFKSGDSVACNSETCYKKYIYALEEYEFDVVAGTTPLSNLKAGDGEGEWKVTCNKDGTPGQEVASLQKAGTDVASLQKVGKDEGRPLWGCASRSSGLWVAEAPDPFCQVSHELKRAPLFDTQESKCFLVYGQGDPADAEEPPRPHPRGNEACGEMPGELDAKCSGVTEATPECILRRNADAGGLLGGQHSYGRLEVCPGGLDGCIEAYGTNALKLFGLASLPKPR